MESPGRSELGFDAFIDLTADSDFPLRGMKADHLRRHDARNLVRMIEISNAPVNARPRLVLEMAAAKRKLSHLTNAPGQIFGRRGFRPIEIVRIFQSVRLAHGNADTDLVAGAVRAAA